MQRKEVGILIFPDVEVLDFTGPFEVFSATRLDESKRRQEPSPFVVSILAQGKEPVAASGGLQVIPHLSLEECPRLDILVVPGGWGVRREIHNPTLIRWIEAQGRTVDTLASVCTGAMLLGQAGLLAGRRATTHWRSLQWMEESFPNVKVEPDLHVVEDGKVITSAGISAGIDMALCVVARYFGEGVSRATARHMEYPYPENLSRRR